MMQHSDAVDAIETLRSKGQSENIRLKSSKITARKIPCCNFRCHAEIDSNHGRSPAGGHVGESTHAAADIEHELAFQFVRRESCLAPEVALRLRALRIVELRAVITLPLEAETPRVIFGGDEPNHATLFREHLPANR